MTTVPTLNLTHIHLSVDDDGVATLEFDRAGESMNTLSPDLFEDLRTAIDHIERDDDIGAVVLASAKPTGFIAGADVRWLATRRDLSDVLPDFTEAGQVIHRLENIWLESGRPVVAAIHGPCLGGGLEIALAASVRVCSNDDATQLGQPEVKLGLIPGAGGTQRLPRLVGIAAGLDLILTGRSVGVRTAHKMGLVDEVCPQEVLLDVAKTRALSAAGSPESTSNGAIARLKSWLAPSHIQQLALEENPVGRRILFSKAEEAMLAQTKGNYPAPPAALRAVRTGIEEGLHAGYAAEIDEFAKLVVSPEAKALISIFLATQELKRDTGVAGEHSTREIARVGILGGGLMGAGIATVNTTHAGVNSRIKEIDDEGVRRAVAHVHNEINRRVKRRRLKPRAAERAMQRVTGSTSWDGVADADLVIEAVFEDVDLKRTMLEEVERLGDEHVIFASNTSSIPIASIASAAKAPERVIGMHYFSPVEKMPLLEVVVSDETAPEVTATCVAFGKRQGKTVIVVNDGAGFYTTRILAPYAGETYALLDEGVSIEAIDGAMTAWGFPVGPITLADEVGIDVTAKIGLVLNDALGERFTPPESHGRLVADGRKGRKNSRGFYRYQSGERSGVDESVYAVLGVANRIAMGQADIQDRIVLQFVNEAARCLEEGILRSARDGDIGAVFGVGFPPFRGGPFMWIDHVGADNVVDKLDRLRERHGPRFEAATIIREHARSGELFRT